MKTKYTKLSMMQSVLRQLHSIETAVMKVCKDLVFVVDWGDI